MTATARATAAPDEEARTRLHTILRFAAGTSGAFVLCEAMGWYPTFLAPLLAGVLLANLPAAPPFKVGLVLVLIQGAGAYGAYFLTSLLHETPAVLFGAIAVILLICFANLTRGRGFLPILLILVAFSTVPVVTMMTPQQAGALPLAFTRGMIVAVISVWVVHAFWPRMPPPVPRPPRAAFDSPIGMALTGVAIVLPLMLIYLMYGLTNALPVLITTVVLVINFEAKLSLMQGTAMMIGNFIGGFVAVASYALLHVAPSLAALALIAFIVAFWFATIIEGGGPRGTVALITFNQAVVLFSLSIAPGGSSSGLWLTRLIEFGIACTFAVGMMNLLFPLLNSLTGRRSS